MNLFNLKNEVYDLKRDLFIKREDINFSDFYFTSCLPFEYKPMEYFYGKYGTPYPAIYLFFHQVLGRQEDVNRMY
jgi:1-aminocyclopropane-1-carboxylate deaminase/D-cysteine desulfhydrase-like pyridoxal-dependent ACC family enzyme